VDPDPRLVLFPRIFCKRHATPFADARRRFRPFNAFAWPCFCTRIRTWATMLQRNASGCHLDKSNAGVDAGQPGIFRLRTEQDAAERPIFPPLDQALIRAMACETVAETGLPLSRQSIADLTSRSQKDLGKAISRSTVWRVLHEDAIKPWQYEHWIFPRDPAFADKAGPILDLYAGFWEGRPLGKRDYILSSDEKTSIQARRRRHEESPPARKQRRRIESEYERKGALQYLAAWDVQRGLVLGRCEAKTGIEPFGRLVDQILDREPYRDAERLFLVVDNGSSHRGKASIHRMRRRDRRIILIHTPVHASWLNQVEIYFSIIQRKVLTPNDFANLAAIRLRLALYEELTNAKPKPFAWKFTRHDLTNWLKRASPHFIAAPAA
jgi:DDE superfamily endonuclease